MSCFIFRNNTIERFFPKGYLFSGYDDISFIPKDAESYVWYYQAPVTCENNLIVDEIEGYIEKFDYVCSKINKDKTIVALTMDVLFSVSLTDDNHTLTSAVSRYNDNLFLSEQKYNNLKVIDIMEFTRKYAMSELFDWKFYFMTQMGMNPRLSREFIEWWEKKMSHIALKRKKCVVLDLDNTLWGGIIGEDGIDGISIGGDYPGKAFLYWQKKLLELSESGIILTVCSKNNEQDVLDAWEKNPFMILRKENFAACRINWLDKATNIKSLADELNIGLESMVFVDDNPAERDLIRQLLPMVSVPDFPVQPYDLPLFFKKMVEEFFQVYSISDADRNKTEQYRANAARHQAQSTYTDFKDFLKSLRMEIVIDEANDYNIQRIAQMTQKTNQFNLTTHRYTDSDIRGFISNDWKIWCISVSDRFGDSGISGCIMITPSGEVDTFLLSCRILGKGIEKAFIKKILSIMYGHGTEALSARYIPTNKNSQVKEFWESVGFTCDSCSTEGEKLYSIQLDESDFEVEEYYHIVIK